MNGAFAPKSWDDASNSFITLAIGVSGSLSIRDRHDVALRRAEVELPRAADLLLGVGDHFIPLRDPTNRARQGEDAGEHRGRDAERALHDPRVEVDVRIELAAH